MMKVVVAVCIYDRFLNLKEWIRNWKSCSTQDAELVIVHNYANEPDRDLYTGYCLDQGIKYIPRQNVGFDIGAFQDVCYNRLASFPQFDYLLWCTDDALPMRKDFIQQYIHKMTKNVAIAAMAISTERKRHVRTTGFMITREASSKLKFPNDPIVTKEECYHFEHRGGLHTMMNQILRLGYKVVQVSNVNLAPLWDSGFKKLRNRSDEHYQHFPKTEEKIPVVKICC